MFIVNLLLDLNGEFKVITYLSYQNFTGYAY